MPKMDKGQEVTGDLKTKITEYVYKKYADHKDKDLDIRDKGTHYTVRKHPTGGYLFLSKDIV